MLVISGGLYPAEILNAAVPSVTQAAVYIPQYGAAWIHVTALDPSLKTGFLDRGGAAGGANRRFPTGGAP